ncbi:hypothetical protein KBI52_29110 [Microvirga sp. HBU67558]|uniref:hypothetical protein n=1 Tax=Microvirga TaxID=186650 RepID=UPI001B38EE7D|nr:MULTISPECIES: hypothetical protein [unclassified Microvirga]MBQ0824262.1 hypothetical protein [Microvirga sp. HBU67558]
MDAFEFEDDDRPIETYPDYIGMAMDYELRLGQELVRLEGFDWKTYQELLEWAAPSHCIGISCSSGKQTIQIDEISWLGSVLDQVPSVRVAYDDHEPLSHGSAAIHIFLKSDTVSYDQLANDIDSLRRALDEDLRQLLSLHGGKL